MPNDTEQDNQENSRQDQGSADTPGGASKQAVGQDIVDGLQQQISQAIQPIIGQLQQRIQQAVQQQLDEALKPVNDLLQKQVEQMLDPVRTALHQQVDQALDPVRVHRAVFQQAEDGQGQR